MNRKLADAPPFDGMEIDAPDDAVITEPNELELDLVASGNGSGRITSTPAGIDCGSVCAASFEDGTLVTLTAEPDESSLFTGWGGACSGTSPVCEVTISAATSVTATFTLKTYTVTVTKAGTGNGTVAGNGIDCGATCDVTVDHGTAISLTATPVTLNNFAGWGGACSGRGTCDLTITNDTDISAAFVLDELSLIVTRGGNGAGTITSAPAGINCPGTCDFVFTANQMVTLTPAPAASSTFSGWSGACTGTGACVVTMDAAKTVTGSFTLKRYALDVTKNNSTGTGNVASTPAGVACGSDCTETYDHGTSVTLTATPSPSSTFAGWTGGGCSGTSTCVVPLTAATTVNAQFTIRSYALGTSVTGMGSISSAPAGIACPTTCSQSYTHGTNVTLTPAPATGWTFTGWGGDCSGTGGCTVAMTQARNVTATFTINRYDLDVNVVGMGTVTGTQIACPGDCTGTYDHDTAVVLSRAAATGWSFTGWTGACTGAGTTCTVTMNQARSVTATFTINSYALTVSFPAANSGTGTVTAPNIACPGDCMESFDHGTVVPVTQTPSTNSNFTGWGGACTGTAGCSVTMDAVKNVTASYALKTYDLDVTVTGMGRVTGTQIDCPTDCAGNYPHGTSVSLTPVPTTGHVFTGWTGACTGNMGCNVSMTAARNVGATFTPVYTLTVAKAGNGTGTVVSNPAGRINCGADCSDPVVSGGTITLEAMPTQPGSVFAGWSGGGCSGTGTCTPTGLTANTTVTATFNRSQHALTITGITGFGRVDSSPGGITACTTVGSANCKAAFDYGTVVTLTPSNGGANASQASVFTGWGGACNGTSACTLTITADTDVTGSWKLAGNIIFTTSISSTGNVGNAQSTCSQLAAAGGLQGTGPGQNDKWMYMLSYGPNFPFTSLLAEVGNPTGWERPDGRPVFNTFSDITASRVIYPPRLDERRNDVGAAKVWTGMNPDGTFASACYAPNTTSQPPPWSGSQGVSFFGLASASSSMMVNFLPGNQTGTQDCAAGARLYCIGIDRKATVGEARTDGRIAFTTRNNAPFNQGIRAMDAQCNTEASQAGLPGSYKSFAPALLPFGYDGCAQANGCPVTAIGRFNVNDKPWVRAGDQIPIVARAADLANDATRFLRTAPNALATGARISGNEIHWSGSVLPMAPANQNCANWTDPSALGRAGFVGDTNFENWWDFSLFRNRCAAGDTWKQLCFQE